MVEEDMHAQIPKCEIRNMMNTTMVEHEYQAGIIPRTVPFVEAPCVCVRHHYPVVLVCQRHHPLMQSAQMDLFGAVVDERTVVLCGSSHDSVHLLMRAIERGQNPYALTHNRYLLLVARFGAALRIMAWRDVAALGREAARAKWMHPAEDVAL